MRYHHFIHLQGIVGAVLALVFYDSDIGWTALGIYLIWDANRVLKVLHRGILK